MSARTRQGIPQRSAARYRESLWRDYASNKSMFRSWRHSWTTWNEKESLHPRHVITALRPCTRSSDIFRRKSQPVCISVKKSSQSPSGDMLVQPLPTFPRKSWLRSWRSLTSEPPAGRRDAVLLSVLYHTGARVQELADLSAGDVRLEPPAQIRLLGKGRKMRAGPLMGNTVQLLRSHMQENQLHRPDQFDKPLFQNARHQRLTRSGIRYILHKYHVRAQDKRPSLNRRACTHCRAESRSR